MATVPIARVSTALGLAISGVGNTNFSIPPRNPLFSIQQHQGLHDRARSIRAVRALDIASFLDSVNAF